MVSCWKQEILLCNSLEGHVYTTRAYYRSTYTVNIYTVYNISTVFGTVMCKRFRKGSPRTRTETSTCNDKNVIWKSSHQLAKLLLSHGATLLLCYILNHQMRPVSQVSLIDVRSQKVLGLCLRALFKRKQQPQHPEVISARMKQKKPDLRDIMG